MRFVSSLALLVTTALTVGCDDLEPPGETSPASLPDGSVEAQGPGDTRTLTVDASQESAWVYLDLDRDPAARAADPSALPGWDIALQRYHIKLNGGVSGSAGVLASARRGEDFAALREAPTDGYGSDLSDGPDDDLTPQYVLSTGDDGWWAYDAGTHMLSPRPHVYVLKSSEGAYLKLQVQSYYNEAGSSGYPGLAWGRLAPPSGALTPRDGGAPALDATTSASKP